MDASAGINTPTLPSVEDASTKEEDYFFTSLGLDNDEDNQDTASRETTKTQDDDLLRPRNRDERMRAAYEESKRLYKAEHGYTETGVSRIISRSSRISANLDLQWYIGLDRHPHEYTSQVVSSKSGNVHIEASDALEVDQKMLGKSLYEPWATVLEAEPYST
jgi:hypothetical protein